MWFRNLQLYRLPEDFTLDLDALDEALAQHGFTGCAPSQPASLGWVEPLGKDGQSLIHVANGRVMVCAKLEERILPGSVVREELDARIEAIEEKEGRKVRGKEKTQLKDEITLDLLPKAFTRGRLTYAYVDPAAHWLLVDAATARRAEDLLSLLRESIGSLPAKPIRIEQNPNALFTAWLREGQPPGAFTLLDQCELKDPASDGGIVRIRRQDLTGDEIGVHLEAGKQASQIALDFDERINFVLDDNLAIKRLKFGDAVLDEADDAMAETAAERFDADFTLMAGEIARLLPALVEALGGEKE